MDSPKPYAAIFLHPDSRAELLRWWAAVVKIPLLTAVHADHVTLVYDPTPDEQRLIDVGASRVVRVSGWNADVRGQAVAVEGARTSKNKHPHVTIAVQAPTEAVYSNTLLEQRVIAAPGPLLRGTIDIRF